MFDIYQYFIKSRINFSVQNIFVIPFAINIIILIEAMIMRTATRLRFLYGNLKDSDRIFTNVYRDGDPYIDGALKRVIKFLKIGRLVSN